jgi:hypothetical protein
VEALKDESSRVELSVIGEREKEEKKVWVDGS